jgi:hypothetical protein
MIMPYSKHPLLALIPAICVGLVIMLAGSRPTYAKPRVRAVSPARLKAMNPPARARLNAAVREMRQRGIRPRLTSTYRSRAEQRALYRCAQNRRCRVRRGVYGANPPGASKHETGLAVDIAGIATGPRRQRKGGRWCGLCKSMVSPGVTA